MKPDFSDRPAFSFRAIGISSNKSTEFKNDSKPIDFYLCRMRQLKRDLESAGYDFSCCNYDIPIPYTIEALENLK